MDQLLEQVASPARQRALSMPVDAVSDPKLKQWFIRQMAKEKDEETDGEKARADSLQDEALPGQMPVRSKRAFACGQRRRRRDASGFRAVFGAASETAALPRP